MKRKRIVIENAVDPLTLSQNRRAIFTYQLCNFDPVVSGVEIRVR